MPEEEEQVIEPTDPDPTDPPVEDDRVETDPPESTPEPEDFLVIGERQRYKTRDAAVEGFTQAGKRIDQYSRHGTPEEVEAELQRLGEYDRLAKPDEKKAPDPLDGLTPEHRGQWGEFEKRFPGVAERMGYVRRDDVAAMVNEELSTRAAYDNARTEFVELAKADGRELTPSAIGSLQRYVQAMATDDPALNQLWLAGDIKGFAKEAYERLYGASPTPQSNGTADKVERPRDSRGKFTQAADYQDVKDRTGKLPKGPPKGSGAPLKGGDELSLEDQINPVKRLARSKAFLEKLGVNG